MIRRWRGGREIEGEEDEK
jgi:hypothetical protein